MHGPAVSNQGHAGSVTATRQTLINGTNDACSFKQAWLIVNKGNTSVSFRFIQNCSYFGSKWQMLSFWKVLFETNTGVLESINTVSISHIESMLERKDIKYCVNLL